MMIIKQLVIYISDPQSPKDHDNDGAMTDDRLMTSKDGKIFKEHNRFSSKPLTL